ncbi:MAG TPA: hypothetical protein VF060_10790 [Trebonia sp.]
MNLRTMLSAKLPQDDVGATLRHSDGIRGQRYTEIFLIGGHAIIHQLTAGIYNTVGLHDPDGTLLDDPDGNTYCMKSASLITDTGQTYDSLKTQDEPGNTYNRVGGAYSNYKP